MRTMVGFLLILLLLAAPSASWAQPAGARTLPEHVAADPEAPPVTAENLLASEQFWPYQVKLVEPWPPEGRAKPLRAGQQGVLLRVQAGGRLDVDFGRHGNYVVPVDRTDALENANRIRKGELSKLAPNLTLAIGPRLLTSAGKRLAPLGLEATEGVRGYLLVLADPSAETFPALAASLAPLAARDGLMTVLLPYGTAKSPASKGEARDAAVRDALIAAGWKVPFLYSHLVSSYRESLLGQDVEPPAVSLQTSEGRVLLARPWSPGVTVDLGAALDRDLPATQVSAAAP